MHRILDRLVGHIGRFHRDPAGNVAVVFALSLMPILLATGIAVDYGRMTNAKARLQNATDTVALTIAKDIERGRTTAQIKGDINSVFSNEMKTAGLSAWTVDYDYDSTNSVVTATSKASVKSVMLGIMAVNTLPVDAQAQAAFGTDYVEIALVLDNTGSMNNSSKLSSLKTAATSMIDKLAATQAGKEGRASVSVVPFGVSVNVGTDYDAASWLGGRETYDTCGWQWITTGRYSGYWQWTCTTSNKQWDGCVGDRNAPYTNSNASASASNSATLYPRDYGHCTTAAMLPLTTDFTTAKTTINNLYASGNTNVPIGAMWGWNMLTPSGPASNAQVSTASKRVSRYAVILTDGDNTQNTLGQGVSSIDDNTTAVCSGMKSAGVTVFTIRVINGNATLLKSCATSADYYFDVSDPSTLTSVFTKILSNITKLRLTS